MKPVKTKPGDGVRMIPIGCRSHSGLIPYIRTCLEMVYKVSRTDAVLVHLSKPQPNGAMSAILKRLASKIPLVLDCDDWEGVGGYAEEMPLMHWRKKVWSLTVTWLERKIPFYADAVMVASRTLQRRIAQLGVENKKVFYVPNGIFLQDFPGISDANEYLPQCEPDQSILYVGSLKAEHDVDLLIKAMRYVLRERKNTKLLIIGDGPIRERLVVLAKSLGITEQVLFFGRVTQTSLLKILQMANIAALPMRDTRIHRSASHTKLLEYLAAGRCVVAGAVGQASDIITNMRTGILVKPGCPEALAEALIFALKNKRLVEALQACAKQYATTHLTWDKRIDTVERAYEFALSRYRLSSFSVGC